MTYTITNQCIGCDRCQSLCPTGAIQQDGSRYWIDATLCNDCVGFYGVAQCAAVCPTNQGCVPGLTSVFSEARFLNAMDYWDRWFVTYNQMVTQLQAADKTAYWENWFATYANKMSKLIQSRNLPTLKA